MNKRILYGIVGLALTVGLFFLGREIYVSNTPYTAPPSDEWQPYVDGLDAEQELVMIETDDGTLIEAMMFVPNGGSDQKAAVVWTGVHPTERITITAGG